MYQRPTSPQLIGGVLDDAVRLLKAGFTQVVGLALVGGAISRVWRLFDDSLDSLSAGELGELNAQAVFNENALLILTGGLAGLYFYLATVARMSAFASDRPISIVEALRRAALRFPALLVCVFAVVVSISIPFLFVLFATVVQQAGVAIIIGIIGLLALVLALAAVVYLCLASLLVVTANIGGVAALRRSFNLMRRNFWRTTVVLTIGSIVMFSVTVALSAVGLAVIALFSFGNASVSVAVVYYLVEIVGSSINMPFWVALSLALLRDLELRREGDDLASRIEAAQ